ncbi:MAG: NAD kinase, partial [Cytophagaceae bacterium]
MKFAIHGRPVNDNSLKYIKELFEVLGKRGSDVRIFAPFSNFLEKKGLSGKFKTYASREEMGEADIVLSLGGDGTLLEAITYVGANETPILGINMGRLGFLATTTQEEAGKAIAELYEGAYKTDERSLIKVVSDEDLFNGINFGLNEFTILKRDTSSMIVVHTYIDGEYLNSYWADGLIVSTPTGSTGYSLSCGGPLVLPQSNNFIIAPVSPHNLNVRPMVVSDNSVISFQIEGRSKHFLVSLDSRSKSVAADIKIAVKKEDFKVKLINLKGNNYL